MSVSRAQWCCLTVVLAVVLALLCGPGTAFAADGRPAARAAAGATAPAPAPAPVPATVTPTATDTDTDAVVALDPDSRPTRVPGCGKNKNADDAPALPGRARAGADQAPGLAEWGLSAATGPEPVGPRVRIRPRGPAAAAPTPVELSVLRV